MKPPTTNPLLIIGISRYSLFRHFLLTAAALLLLTSARSNGITFAALDEWQASPVNGNWNNAANWSPAVPNGSSDTAIFETSIITSVSLTANTQVAAISFASGASAFTITASPALTLTISGVGITNNSGITQNFVTAVNNSGFGNHGTIVFSNSATAGSMTAFTNNGGTLSGASGGETDFFNTSTAGSATITNNGATVFGAFGGETVFQDTATAGSATINNNNGGIYRAGLTLFSNTATAGSATINNNAATVVGGGGEAGSTEFFNSSTAGSATINNNGALGVDGGLTKFFNTSTAGSAIINNNGGAVVGATAGSTEFFNSSTAGSASINNNGGTAIRTGGGLTEFFNSSSAGSATIHNTAATTGDSFAGSTQFFNSSSAGSGTFTNDGNALNDVGPFLSNAAFTLFSDSSSAGSANFTNNGATASGGAAGLTEFDGSYSAAPSAGSATFTNNGGTASGAAGGSTQFSGKFFPTDAVPFPTAGSAIFTNNGGTASGAAGGFTFLSGSSAGNAIFTDNGGTASGAAGGLTEFAASTASSATITNNGGTATDATGGLTEFGGSATAGSATITNNGSAFSNSMIFNGSGGRTQFITDATADSARLIANGGTGTGGSIQFFNDSLGGTSTVKVFGNGNLDISSHDIGSVTIGSLEGSGNVFVGPNNLTVGSNNQSKTFSGVISEIGGTTTGNTGSLTKIGTGGLTLSGVNAYSGATAVNSGKLVVDGSIASSSGVSVAAGATLAGHGNVSAISGAGTVAPGDSPGILTGTHLNPSAGIDLSFEFLQAGSPTYNNAAASGNAVLHLTDLLPFTTALTSANQITIDFSGASLAAGEVFRGGFFTDTATATSEVSNATFLYTGLNGFTVHFDGFVTEPIAAFASATVINGTVLQFDIVGGGGGGSVPDSGASVLLFGLALTGIVFLQSSMRVARTEQKRRTNMPNGEKQNRGVIFLVALTLFAAPVFAGSATWKQSPGSSDWDTANNWTPATVPASQFDTATFDLSNTTNVSISSDTTVSGIVFTSNAASNPFTITDNHILTIAGIQNVPSGISNNSGVTQSFITTVHLNSSGLVSEIVFNGDFTTAGTNTVFTNNAPSSSDAKAGLMVFNGFSRSGSTIINNIGGSGAGAGGGQTVFHNDAGVGNGSTINNYGGSASTAHGGTTSFLETSGSLASATINNYAGSVSGADGGETIFGINTLDGGFNSGTVNNFGSSVSGALAGHTEFNQRYGAGGTINNLAATVRSGFGGQTEFHNTSVVSGGTINNNGASVSGTFNTLTQFFDSSTVLAATINNNGASAANAGVGQTIFHATSAAGAFLGAPIINNNPGTTVTAAPGGNTQFDDYSTFNNPDSVINNNGATISQAGYTQFRDHSSAVEGTINNNGGATFQLAAGGFTDFRNNSKAVQVFINNNAATANGAHGGQTRFYDMSAAGFAAINNNGASVQGANGGETDFYNTSSAGGATITSNGGIGSLAKGAETIFHDSSDAGSATLIANSGTNFRIFPGIGFGGEILFKDNSTGGTSQVKVYGNGIVDISGHSAPGITIGSVEGSGNVFLGSNNLSVGSNNRDTAFSGVIHDGAFGGGGGSGGSVTKIGTGTLIASGTNTYTGATAVDAGKLVVDGSIASSSGVSVAAGATLAGHGNVSAISGAGTVAPGDSPGILTGTHLNPSAGIDLIFDFLQAGSPTYGNAAASGNAVLHLTDLLPFTTALTSANQITIDFSGASVAAGEVFRGGFFTDTATATSEVSNATFLYTGLNGFTVHFDGFVTEPIAAFASSTVINGTVLQFDIEGNGGGSVPDSGKSVLLFSLTLAGLAFFQQVLRAHDQPGK